MSTESAGWLLKTPGSFPSRTIDLQLQVWDYLYVKFTSAKSAAMSQSDRCVVWRQWQLSGRRGMSPGGIASDARVISSGSHHAHAPAAAAAARWSIETCRPVASTSGVDCRSVSWEPDSRTDGRATSQIARCGPSVASVIQWDFMLLASNITVRASGMPCNQPHRLIYSRQPPLGFHLL